jgi:uncharacterized membrane protein YjgN (DUF898 family)
MTTLNDPAPLPAPVPGGNQANRYRLVFLGRGGEYFAIWVVNLLLTVVTIGIYGAWAKVRTQRYFHGVTELDGSRFGYHGDPIKILIGRLIGVAILVPYVILGKVAPTFSALLALAVAFAVPWLITRAMRFRLKVTSYRNIRFAFAREPRVLRDAYSRYMLLPILAVPTFGLLLPYVAHQQFAWLINNSRYGRTVFQAEPCVGRVYRAYAAFLFVVIVLFAAVAVIAAAAFKASGGGDGSSSRSPPVAVAIVFMLAALVIVPVLRAFQDWVHKLIYDRVSLGSVRVAAHYSIGGLLALRFGNMLMLIFSLGLAYPWVRCRTARYLLGGIELVAPSGLDGFIADSTPDETAIGDQIASVLDVDIAIGV